ncbi:MAG: leucine-rich repeat protein [Clostridia bacterium]|nr:leucine-rich repeat protein [Clostridia bacterium]
MNKKAVVKATTVVLSVLLATILLLSVFLPTLGRSYALEGGYVKQFTDSIITNRNQYLDSSKVFELPSAVKDDDDISVIISLSTAPLIDRYNQTDKSMSFTEYAFSDEADALRKEIEKEKQEVLKTLDEQGVAYTLGADYSAILTGFEIVIKAKNYKTVAQSLDKDMTSIVCEVYKKAETQLVENKVSVYDTGIFDTSSYIDKYKYDGTGVVVAVLDTGLDYTHSAFSVENFTADRTKLGLTKQMVASLIGQTKASKLVNGLGADDVYINEKVPFSFDYADKDSDVYSLHNNHGTHVSGVIVGKDDVITGVAPNAQLVSMKIFSDTKDSAIASWILSALEDCVILGVDVINMSLGTACGFSRESDEEKISGVYEKIRAQGISLVVAASNSFASSNGSEKNGNLGLTSNPDTATVGSPSTYEGAMSVASINGVKTPYILFNGKIVYFTEATDAAAEEKFFVDEFLQEGVNDLEVEFVLIPGVGRDVEYTGIDVTGKIALVKRGDTTFEEKAQAAQKAGAIGVIVFNNTSGEIRMNVGTVSIPVCSISQEDGEVLASAKRGTIKISRDQTSGPFMSDFSSWGPSPSLGIKPEITAHGGNILSAITGGGYDRLSGTSMACPNTAGVMILLRQYVMDKFPDIKDDSVKVTALVNQLLMSTADIVYNKNGLPYAVRKQGAGLANIFSATQTTALILTRDKNGEIMDKSKLELGDDPEKTGVYDLSFEIKNFGAKTNTYKLSTYVLTEGVSDVKTARGETTVSEEGYLLSGATVSFTIENGTQNGDSLSVEAGKTAKVKVTITLSSEDKKYLDESFENGMYVEGFVVLTATSAETEDLSVPFLSFYGDWTKAPILDLDYFETNKDELNDSIPADEKTLPDAYATRPIGGMFSDYISYLGSYYFQQNPNDQIISASRDYIAISNVKVPDSATEADQDIATIHSIRFIWTGMLRNAVKVVVTITDDATGEVIFETVDDDVRKSYSDGGSYIYPANVEVEFDATEHNLKNNTKYTVKMVAYMDYEDGGLETNEKNTFEFPFTTDFEAPIITGCTFRSEYDSDLERDRLFATIAVYDNHYSMSMQPGYLTTVTDPATGLDSFQLVPFSTYMTPIYSVRNGTTYVEYELTDYIYALKESSHVKNSFIVSVYDYALNHATYEIGLPDDYIDFRFDAGEDEEGNPNTEITLNPNELYTIKIDGYSDDEAWGDLLRFDSSNKKVVRVVNGKLVAVGSGLATVSATHVKDNSKKAFLNVRVLGPEDEGYMEYDKPVADSFKINGYEVLKAYEIMSNEDRDLGQVGSFKYFAKNEALSIKLYPSESVRIEAILEAYFPDDCQVVFSTGNDKVVTVDQNGVVTGVSEGFANITVKVLLDGKSTYETKSVSIEVKDPFVRTAPTLQHYYGLGGVVEIPSDLRITQIGAFAFSNFEYVLKTPEEFAEDDNSMTKQSPIGDNTITKVIIPEGVKKIDAYAFARLTALKEVVLPSTIEAIEYGAFEGCISLERVVGLENVQLINYAAFRNCNLKGTIKLDKIRAIGDYAFAENGSYRYNATYGYYELVSSKLEGVILPPELQSIGAYAFYHNTALKNVEVKAEKVKYGPYVFAYCTQLDKFSMNASVIPEGAFMGCTALTEVTIGNDVNTIGENAFMNCNSLTKAEIGKNVGFIDRIAFASTAISKFVVSQDNPSYKSSSDGLYILSKDGSTILVASPTLSGEVNITDSTITAIGNGAFAHNNKITSINAPSVVVVDDYAFFMARNLKSLSLGTLTKIGKYSFANTSISVLPTLNSIKTISDYAFSNTKLTAVVIGNDVEICEGAFYNCEELVSVTIGDNCVVGMGAFMNSWGDKTPQYIQDTKYSTKVYYRHYPSKLTQVTIGKNVTLGHSSFSGLTSLEAVTIGEGSKIGEMAFYNCASLATIDLSKAVSIGKLAFSGDEIETASSQGGAGYGVDADGNYVYHIYASRIEIADLSSLTELGEKAFALCPELKEVTLGTGLKEIENQAFIRCLKLERINLESVEKIGLEAFAESSLKEINLSSIKVIGPYAFTESAKLEKVILSENAIEIDEGAFVNCKKLSTVENLDKVARLGKYSFAVTALTGAKLTGAIEIGEGAFLKENVTDFDLDLSGNKVLRVLGDNPFALCRIKPLYIVEEETFNGKTYYKNVYDYDISENIHVINGSIYQDVPNGLELITYAPRDNSYVELAEGTVRLSAYSLAGSEIVRIKLPYTLASIGHKSFFDCNKLVTVIFTSHYAPVLEEEFDQGYFIPDNIPGSKGETPGYEVSTGAYVPGLGLSPYFMFNPMVNTETVNERGEYVYNYFCFFYGASFVDYMGHYEPNLVMIRPSNGQEYESFTMNQYFKTVIDGSVAADKVTLEAIEAINRLPANVKLADKPLVVLARIAYDKIATKDQQALVTNYGALLTAEQRILAFEQTGNEDVPEEIQPQAPFNPVPMLITFVCVEAVLLGVIIALGIVFYKKKLWIFK